MVKRGQRDPTDGEDVIKKAKIEAQERVAARIKKWADEHSSPQVKKGPSESTKATVISDESWVVSNEASEPATKRSQRKPGHPSLLGFEEPEPKQTRRRIVNDTTTYSTKPDITKKSAKTTRAKYLSSTEGEEDTIAGEIVRNPGTTLLTEATASDVSSDSESSVKAPVAEVAERSAPAEDKGNVDNALVSLWDHFWGCLNTIFQTITPVYIGIVLALSGVTQLFGAGSSVGNAASLASVVISLVYAVCVAMFVTILFPCILLVRAVDQVLFSSGGAVLKSSAVEFGSVCFIALVYLLFYQYVAFKVSDIHAS